MALPKKWVLPVLLLFVAFFILSNPEAAGPQARDFFGWVGEQVSAVGTFVDGVLADEEPVPVTTETPDAS